MSKKTTARRKAAKKPAKRKNKTSAKRKTKSKSKAKSVRVSRTAVKVDELSLQDIKSLEKELQKAKADARDRERKALKAKIDKLLAGSGFTIFELYGIGGKKRGKSVSVARYANPEDPTDTWTGRGRKPNWLLAQLSKGNKVEDFAI